MFNLIVSIGTLIYQNSSGIESISRVPQNWWGLLE
jgi:hypothetical protein